MTRFVRNSGACVKAYWENGGSSSSHCGFELCDSVRIIRDDLMNNKKLIHPIIIGSFQLFPGNIRSRKGKNENDHNYNNLFIKLQPKLKIQINLRNS